MKTTKLWLTIHSFFKCGLAISNFFRRSIFNFNLKLAEVALLRRHHESWRGGRHSEARKGVRHGAARRPRQVCLAAAHAVSPGPHYGCYFDCEGLRLAPALPLPALQLPALPQPALPLPALQLPALPQPALPLPLPVSPLPA
jgi:hypothetical protein